MRSLAALFLLIAAAAQAQPVVTDQVVWRTTSPATTYRPAPQAARVAADGGGFVVAWSEVIDGLSRAYAGRLDASGRLLTVGVRTAGTADAASISPFGDRYIAAWLEPEAGDQRPLLVTGALDRDFKLLAARPVGLTSGPPVVRTTPLRAFIGSGGFVYEVDKDGTPVIVYDLPRPLDDLAAAGEQVGYVVHAMPLTAFICPFGCGPVTPTYKYVLTFTWLYRLTTETTLRFKSDAPAAIASSDKEFLVVWFETPGIKVSLFGSSFKPFLVSMRGTALDRLTQPQVAWDGARWVVVWANGDSIEGAVIASDLTVKPVSVSARGRRPSIAAARNGRFIVTYEVVDYAACRLASRLIDFTPPGQRERAVR